MWTNGIRPFYIVHDGKVIQNVDVEERAEELMVQLADRNWWRRGRSNNGRDWLVPRRREIGLSNPLPGMLIANSSAIPAAVLALLLLTSDKPRQEKDGEWRPDPRKKENKYQTVCK